jgi:hypothetical protein
MASELSTLTSAESSAVTTTLDSIRAAMTGRAFEWTLYVPYGKSCGEAAQDRGAYIANYLPSNWYVDTYAWSSGLHIANVVYFQAADRYFYCWVLDGYGYPVTDDLLSFLCRTSALPAEGAYLGTTRFYKFCSSQRRRGRGMSTGVRLPAVTDALLGKPDSNPLVKE